MSKRWTRVPRIVAAVTAVTLSVAVLAGCQSAAVPDPSPDAQGELPAEVQGALQSAVEGAMAATKSSGAIVGVWAPWAGNWVTGLGTTEPGGSTAPTPDMPFRVGTIGATMTCAVLLRLVDQGSVSLDAAVDSILTRQASIKGITLRQLCQSDAGLADFTSNLAPTFVQNPTRIWPPAELIANGLVQGSLSTPGQAYRRSSTGYVLLGQALETQTRRSAQELFESELFGPAGLANTSFPESADLDAPDNALPGYSYPMDITGAVQCTQPEPIDRASSSMLDTAGGQISTIGDLKRFLQLYLTGGLLSDGLRDQITKTVPDAAVDSDAYGGGLGVAKLGPLFGLSGWAPGYLTAMYADPQSGLVIVFALNNSTAGAGIAESLVQQIVAIMAGVPAGNGGTVVAAPPWKAKDAAAAVASQSVCNTPAPAPAPAG